MARSIAHTTLLLLPVQIVFRAGEAVLPLLLATWFGRSVATDVYQFTWAVFTFAGSLVFSVYQDSSLVPILAEIRAKDRDMVPRVTGSLLAHTVVFGAALSALIGLGALGWFRLRYDDASFALSARMVLPFCVLLVALSVRTFFSTLLNAAHHFFAAPVASCLSVVTMLGLLALLRHRLGIVAVPIATLAGELVALGTLALLAVRGVGMRIGWTFERPEPVRRVARLLSSEVGGSVVTRVNPVVDQLMAGMAGVIGGGTLLRYAGDVASVPTSLLQATLLPVLLSHLSDAHATGAARALRPTVTRAIGWVVLVLVAASALVWAVRGPLLRAVFLHGEMDAEGVARMIRILPYHLVGLAPFGALLILVRAHIALKNSRIMVSMGVLNATLNAVFNVVLLRAIGLEGIALSTSCVQLVVAIVLWLKLDAKLALLERAPAGAPAGG